MKTIFEQNQESVTVAREGSVGLEASQASVAPAKRVPAWWKPGGEWPDFAERRAELRKLGMRPLTPEETEEFHRLLRGDREI